MSPPRPRVLIIGIDAATPQLVGPWVEDGSLPTLGRLMRAGAWGPLRSVPTASSPAAWSTFATGANPGRHGVFYFTERIPGTYRYRYVNGSTRDGMPFWQVLEAKGFRVGLLNVPMTYPAESLQGFVIAGMDAPDARAQGFAYPPGLVVDLEQALGPFGDHGSISAAIGQDVLRGRLDRAATTLIDRVETRTRWAEHLLRMRRPDVFVAVHTEVDGAQHFFWKYTDPRHPEYSAAAARRHGDVIRRVYQKVDESLARLQVAFGPADLTVVLSDHGAGIAPFPVDPGFFLRSVLVETGLFVPRAGPGPRSGRRADLLRRIYEVANPRVPRPIKAWLRRRAPGLARRYRRGGLYEAADWAATRAYPSGSSGVFINLRGREPQGIVAPGAEYEALRDRIAADLLACVDPVTAQPMVARVYRREDLYAGPYVDDAPDLTLQLQEGIFHGFQLGGRRVMLDRLRAANAQEAMSGAHRPLGILVLAGRGVLSGAVPAEARLEDVAPSLLHALDCPLPAETDGRVLAEIFDTEIGERPVRRLAAGRRGPRREYSAAEAAAVEERLRDLGYI